MRIQRSRHDWRRKKLHGLRQTPKTTAALAILSHATPSTSRRSKSGGFPIAAYVRIRPEPRQLQRVAELAAETPEVVECHRITGEDCFLMKVHVPAVDQLERILDRFLPYGQTTTSIVQSSPVPSRPLPLPTLMNTL